VLIWCIDKLIWCGPSYHQALAIVQPVPAALASCCIATDIRPVLPSRYLFFLPPSRFSLATALRSRRPLPPSRSRPIACLLGANTNFVTKGLFWKTLQFEL